MISAASAKPSQAQAPPRRNTGLHGAFWTRLLLRVLPVLPPWLCFCLVPPVSFLIYLLATEQRHAVLANLAALQPGFPRWRHWWEGRRVIEQFALTYLDRLWHMYMGRPVEWEFENLHVFDQIRQQPDGVLIFTIHSGNYDIGASLFAAKLGRPLHIVRVPEQTAELQRLRSAELHAAEAENPNLKVHYNEKDSHLGMELYRLLLAGETVAVQGDRIVSGVASIPICHGGLQFAIPRGPLVLAEAARVPCFPIFLRRLGRLRYHITVGPAFHDGRERWRAEEIGRAWLPIMVAQVAAHWDQWFVFEHLVRPAPPQA